MDTIKNLIRVGLFAWWTGPIAARHGSRKLNKQVKKNLKAQDPNLYPFEERMIYHRKKMKGILKRAGINVEVIGEENIPRGAAWIVPNHTSNFDGAYLSRALSHKLDIIPVAKDDLKNSRMVSGYFKGVDGMFIDRKSPRQALTLLEGAAQYAKNKNRAIVIFPEGERSLTGELLDFKNGSFKFPQKYFIPILPITILGTVEARRVWSLKTRTVTVIVHKPIKPIEHSKLPTDILGRRVRDMIAKDIEDWKAGLTKKELDFHNELVEKQKINMQKRADKIAAEQEKIRQELSK